MNTFKIMKEALEKISNACDTFDMTGKSDYDCFEECIFIASKALSLLEEEEKQHCLVDLCIYNLHYKCPHNNYLPFSKQIKDTSECPINF